MSVQTLDSEELLHLALIDIGNADHEGAIDKLKRALDSSSSDARLHFLLGAEYAEIGLRDRAKESTSKALSLNPTLHAARFQLGMLHLVSGQIDDARREWSPLDALGDKAGMVLYKNALLSFEDNDPGRGLALLREGIAANTGDAALMAEMAKTLQRAEERLSRPGSVSEPSSSATPIGTSELLSRYEDGAAADQPRKRKH
jgi:Flp pilus assembly protein TadD